MLNITHYQRNANQNHNEVPLHTSSGCLLSTCLQAINAGFKSVDGSHLSFNIILSVSPPPPPPLFMSLVWWNRLPYCLLLCGDSHPARSWGQPLTNSQLGTEALSPTILKELNPANNHGISKVAPPQVLPGDSCSPSYSCLRPVGDSESKHLSQALLQPESRPTEAMWFEAAKFGGDLLCSNSKLIQWLRPE